MTNSANAVLMGAVAMASLVAALFFFRFWRQTGDMLFAFFAIAFAIDAVARFALGITQGGEEHEPFYYVMRLLTFGLILIAIGHKNRPLS